MIFHITRTSLRMESQPCKEAVKVMLLFHDYRTCTLAEAIERNLFKKNPYCEWFDLREINGHAVASYNREGWIIEFSTLDQLMAFVDIYGCIGINQSNLIFFNGKSIPELEICDDYR